MPLAALWLRLAGLLSSISPSLSAAFLSAVREIQSRFSEGEIARLISAGDVAVVATAILSTTVMKSAFTVMRDQVRDAITKSATHFTRDVPLLRDGGRILQVEFDVLDTRTVAAVRAFEQEVIKQTAVTMRAGIVEAVQDGLRKGINPRTIARGLRDIVGLTKEQAIWVRNFRDELIRGDAPVFERQLLDKRFLSTIRRAFAGDGLTAAQIDAMVANYRKRMIAYHAETVGRTVAINSMKLGQLQIWQQAVDQGVVDATDITETWVTRIDGRERDTHHAMNGTVIAFGARWYVPGVGLVTYPGEFEFNCRCASVFRVAGRRSSAA